MESTTPQTNVIQYDDFAKLELRVATVVECNAHPNADKLLLLQIDLGTERRQICAGLRQH
jgi:methionyl-tRNA synthetase